MGSAELIFRVTSGQCELGATGGEGEDITLTGDQGEARHQEAQPDQGPHGGGDRERGFSSLLLLEHLK